MEPVLVASSGSEDRSMTSLDEPDEPPAREFAWIGLLSAEADLAERSSEILLHEPGEAE